MTDLERAAETAYRICAEARHVRLGDEVRDALLALPRAPQPAAPPVAEEAGIPFALIQQMENRIALRIAMGSTPRAIAEDVAQIALTASPVHEPGEKEVERVAKLITEWLGYSWDGLGEGSVVAKGFPVWTHGEFGGFQGRKDDMRSLALATLHAGGRTDD